MKILLLGKNGQVGWELQRSLQPLGSIISLDRSIGVNGLCGDITNFEAISNAIEQTQPNVIVNATAYTAVDKAESEIEQADLINHLAVKHLAEICEQKNILFIHYSTDYVFDGTGSAAWSEEDICNPVNLYGKSKRDGEIALEQCGSSFFNFRTSWVYGLHGNNFIKTMLKLATIKEELGIINDQIGAPTGASLIADVTAQVIRFWDLNIVSEENLYGHYHLAAAGECSWYDYAQFIFSQARGYGVDFVLNKVSPIETSAYPTPAKRPLNSRLTTLKLQQNFKLHLPSWELGVAQVIKELHQ